MFGDTLPLDNSTQLELYLVSSYFGRTCVSTVYKIAICDTLSLTFGPEKGVLPLLRYLLCVMSFPHSKLL